MESSSTGAAIQGMALFLISKDKISFSLSVFKRLTFFFSPSCRHIYDYEDLHASDMYDKLEQQLEQLEERKQVEKLRQQEDEQRRAIVFQRQGFQRGVMSQHQQQTKRRRYFHE